MSSKPWITITHPDGTQFIVNWESVKAGFKSMFRTKDSK